MKGLDVYEALPGNNLVIKNRPAGVRGGKISNNMEQFCGNFPRFLHNIEMPNSQNKFFLVYLL